MTKVQQRKLSYGEITQLRRQQEKTAYSQRNRKFDKLPLPRRHFRRDFL